MKIKITALAAKTVAEITTKRTNVSPSHISTEEPFNNEIITSSIRQITVETTEDMDTTTADLEGVQICYRCVKMYTAFSHRDKSYAFENLPFGLASSPASFTECVNRIMVDILTKYKQNITIYIDDILIWGTSTSLILQILDEVLERLEAEHLLLNLEKSVFFVDEVNFLGKIINNDGIKPTEKSLMEIFNFDLPFTMKNTQKLLGHANFLLDHLPRFRIVAQPLYELISRLIKSEAKPSQKVTLSE